MSPESIPLKETILQVSESGEPHDITRSFQASIVDFFASDQQTIKKRHRYSVYDLLYSADLETPLQAIQPGLAGETPALRWIHLPMNNVCHNLQLDKCHILMKKR